MDLLRRWLRKLKSTTIIAVQLRNETTAIQDEKSWQNYKVWTLRQNHYWENNGEKEAEKQPTLRMKNRDKTTKYEHWGKTTIEVWNKREKSLPD